MRKEQVSRNVVITGGGGGLGRVMREQFMASGDRVHVCDVALDFDANTPSPENLRGTVCNVGNSEDVARLFADVAQWMPRVDVLINNVGISGPRAPLEGVSEKEWEEITQVNLLGAVRCMRHVLPGMKQARAGCILNISTSSVHTRPLNRAPYTVTKAALESLTTCMARELGPHGVRCNAIRPGMMDNERMHRVLRRVAVDEGKTVEDVLAGELQYISMRTMVPMESVASLAFYLCSAAAAQITGQVMAVDGGAEWES
jgi:NAD(P)-dependent dehydrogenase (short-subunit alcohol dehydrogenase family)